MPAPSSSRTSTSRATQAVGVATPELALVTDEVSATGGGGGVTGNKATARALRVLEQLAGAPEPQGVTELSRALGMTKNMVHRALVTFVRHGYVVRDETGSRYQLGPGVLRLASVGLPPFDLRELCVPFMELMRDVTGETITLAVPWARNAVTVDGVRGRGTLARRVPLARVMPLHVSPASRAILASFPDVGIEWYLREPLERPTRGAIADPDMLWDELRAVRERGYATIIGDHWQGVNGVSFPIPGSSRYPHGSVTLVAPVQRLTPEVLADVLPELTAIAADLARQSSLYPSDYSLAAP